MSETAEDTAKITTNSLHEVMYELSIAAKINDLEGRTSMRDLRLAT